MQTFGFVPVLDGYGDVDVDYALLENTSVADIYSMFKMGFICYTHRDLLLSEITRHCRKEALRILDGSDKLGSVVSFLIRGEMTFFDCVSGFFDGSSRTYKLIKVIKVSIQIVIALIALLLLSRFLFVPMIVFIFLAYKFWLATGEIDMVERFLRNHQVLVPKRYAYSELVAITRHFRDKLGQGGFGSVFKGELPGGVLVAVKLLNYVQRRAHWWCSTLPMS